VAAKLAMGDHRAEGFHHNPHTDKRCYVRRVIRWRHFDNFKAADCLRRQRGQEFSAPRAAKKPPGSGQPVARHEAAINRVDVEGDVDRVGVLPGEFQRNLSRLVEADLLDVVDGQDIAAALCAPPARRRAALASRQCQAAPGFEAGTFGRFVAQYQGVVCMRSSRSFSLDVNVTVEVNDADAFRRALRDAAPRREIQSSGRPRASAAAHPMRIHAQRRA